MGACVAFELVMTTQVRDWLHALRGGDPVTRRLVAQAIDQLLDEGPGLGRPLVDRITGSSLHNLKELRPGSSGNSEVRILFVFDSSRNALLLIAGDKSGQWKQWYDTAISQAEQAYERYLKARGAVMTDSGFHTNPREGFLQRSVNLDTPPARRPA